MNGSLVLLRHGESTANASGTFTGLLDPPLTDEGVAQAKAAGALIGEHGLVPDIAFTSRLQRTIRTAELVSSVLGATFPTEQLWELNERNYGSLTGRTKAQVREQLGEEAFSHLRRSLHGRPPAMSDGLWSRLNRSPALRGLPPIAVRRSEALSDVVDRLRPVLRDLIVPPVQSGRTVLVVAHGNSLRALCVCIDHLTDPELETLNLPTGQPLRYDLDADGALSPRGGIYLDSTAPVAAAAVAAEGGT